MEEAAPDSEILFQFEDPKFGIKSLLLISEIINGAAKASIQFCSDIDIEFIRNEAKTMAYLNTISSPLIGGACIVFGCNKNHSNINEIINNFLHQIKLFLESNLGISAFHSQTLNQTLNSQSNWQEGIIKNLDKINPEVQIDSFYERSKNVLNRQLIDPRFTIYPKKIMLKEVANAWSLTESIRHFYNFWGGTMNFKRLVIGEWNETTGNASHYLTKHNVFIIAFQNNGKYYYNQQAWNEHELSTFHHSLKNAEPYEVSESDYFKKLDTGGAEIYINGNIEPINEKHINALLKQGYEVHVEQNLSHQSNLLKQLDKKISVIPAFISLSGLERLFYTGGNTQREMEDIEFLIDISNMLEAALMKINQFNMKETGIYQKSIELAQGMLK